MINYRYNNLLSISEISKLIDSKDYIVVKNVSVHGYKEAKIIELDDRFDKINIRFKKQKYALLLDGKVHQNCFKTLRDVEEDIFYINNFKYTLYINKKKI